ncbi:MAG: hypothetical protein Kow00122_17970 [Thermoleophilia bacterium]
MRRESVHVRPGTTLGQLLKVTGVSATGGHAKALIAGGEVSVNAQVEYRRGRKLTDGDVVGVRGAAFVVAVDTPEAERRPAHPR